MYRNAVEMEIKMWDHENLRFVPMFFPIQFKMVQECSALNDSRKWQHDN
jgi:hypothetical protein